MQVRLTLAIICAVLVGVCILTRVSHASQSGFMDSCNSSCRCSRNEDHLAKTTGNCMDSEEAIVRDGRCMSFCVQSVSIAMLAIV